MNRAVKRIAKYIAWFTSMMGGVAYLAVSRIYGFNYGEWWGLSFLLVGAPPLIYLTFKFGAKWDITYLS